MPVEKIQRTLLDFITPAEKARYVKTDAPTRNQRTLLDYLTPLCEDNGIHPFRQFDVLHGRGGDDEWSHCQCGQHIKEEWTLKNVYNGNIAEPIGCVCIQRWFDGNDIHEHLKEMQKQKKIKEGKLFVCPVADCTCTTKNKDWPVCRSHTKRVIVVPSQKQTVGKFKGKEWGELYEKNRGYCEWIAKHPCMTLSKNKYVKAWLDMKIEYDMKMG